MSSIHVNESEFDQKVIASSTPVLVDFWAEWCGPCRQLLPVLEEVAGEMGGKLTIAKVNVDHNQGLAQKFGVRGIPTMILFKDGKAVATKVGGVPKTALVQWINSNVA